MKTLMLSTDTAVLKQEGQVFERITSYGKLCEELHIIVAGGKGESFDVGANVHVYATCSRFKPALFFETLSLGFRICRTASFSSKDLVTSQDPFELGMIAYLVSRVRKIGLHFQVHIDFFSPYYKGESFRQRLQAWIAERLLPRADSIRVVSQKIRNHLISRGISDKRISCTPIFTDWKKIQGAPVVYDLKKRYPAADPLILSASRLVKQKNIPLTVEAFSTLHAKYPSAHLVIVGRGSERKVIERTIANHDLTEAVSLEDWTDDMASYLKTVDIFVLSSDYEGWGLSVVEACAAGTPVVMTDVGCAGEFLIHDKNGSVIPVRDTDALVKELDRLIASPELRERFSQEAHANLSTLMSQEGYYEALRESWGKAVTL